MSFILCKACDYCRPGVAITERFVCRAKTPGYVAASGVTVTQGVAIAQWPEVYPEAGDGCGQGAPKP